MAAALAPRAPTPSRNRRNEHLPPPFSPLRSAKKPRAEDPQRSLCRSPEEMEQFHDRHHVWLRSSAIGLYLRAAEDGSGVYLDPVRASLHAAWAVHIHRFIGGDVLMLHNAANGRYLAATAWWAAANGVGLDDLDQLPSLTVSWFAIRSGYEEDVLLRHNSERFLRAHVRRNLFSYSVSVGVDVFDSPSTMRHWVVETIPPRDSIPRFPNSSPRASISVRRIRFLRLSDEGLAWGSILFTGNSVFYLRNILEGRLGFTVDPNSVMCVRAGRFGRMTPLVTDLPHNNETMYIIFLAPLAVAANGLRHPNVDAP